MMIQGKLKPIHNRREDKKQEIVGPPRPSLQPGPAVFSRDHCACPARVLGEAFPDQREGVGSSKGQSPSLGSRRGRRQESGYFWAGVAGDLTLLDSHASPSKRPSPVVAQLGTTYQILSFSLDSCSASVTSLWFHRWETDAWVSRDALDRGRCNVPLSMSCLLANTNSKLSFISRSLMMRCSSCRASSIRARSDESMTKIRPWVPVPGE